jgi:hypothetical protein
MNNENPYMDLDMAEIVDDFETYQQMIEEEIMQDRECRKHLEDAERIVSAWDNDPEYEDLEDEDEYHDWEGEYDEDEEDE